MAPAIATTPLQLLDNELRYNNGVGESGKIETATPTTKLVKTNSDIIDCRQDNNNAKIITL